MMVLLSGTDATIFDLQTTYFQQVEHKALLLVSHFLSQGLINLYFLDLSTNVRDR
jgi:hypothetical protein